MGFVGIISLAILSTPPENWTKQSRFEDEENFYYVGISSPSNDEKAAHDEAFQMAVKSLVLEHFGREMRIQERVIQDLDSVQASQQLDLADSNVKLKGLKIMAQEWSPMKELKVLRLLLAYPRKERDRELERQQAAENDLPTQTLNRFERRKSSGNAELEVKSDPPEAEVFLDDELIGKTSLEARGLKEGLYNLEIKLHDYERYKTKVLLSPGDKTKLSVSLERSLGILDLTVSPEDAQVEILNANLKIPKQKKQITLPAGEHKIKLSHPQHYERIETIYVAGNSTTYRTFDLVPKDTSVSTSEINTAKSSVPIRVNIRSDSYPVTVIFFDSSRYSELDPIKSPLSRSILLSKAWPYVVAISKHREEIFRSINLITGANQLDFNFASEPASARPQPRYGYSDRIYFKSNLYPIRVRFFDEKTSSEHTIGPDTARYAYVTHPYRAYHAYGPNGEELSGVLDYKLVPLRLDLNFNLSEQSKTMILRNQAQVSTQKSKEVLYWVTFLGLVALASWGSYELYQSTKDKSPHTSGTSGTSGGVRIGGY